jgi:hypothetical protein
LTKWSGHPQWSRPTAVPWKTFAFSSCFKTLKTICASVIAAPGMSEQWPNCLTVGVAFDSKTRTIASLLDASEVGGAVSLRPIPCSWFRPAFCDFGAKKVPVFDAGTNASHDVTQV